MTGALCIHPAQVRVANEVFSITVAQRDQAARVLAVWAQAEAAGRAVASLDGRMIDRPVAERARALLARRGEDTSP